MVRFELRHHALVHLAHGLTLSVGRGIHLVPPSVKFVKGKVSLGCDRRAAWILKEQVTVNNGHNDYY